MSTVPPDELLPSPAELSGELTISALVAEEIRRHRSAIADVLAGRDGRALVVVGPCSIHDPAAALDYACRLAEAARSMSDQLLIVLRAYLEKPRTAVGWKGLLHDPGLDGSEDIAGGLRTGREFLIAAAASGLPLAGEFVEPMLAPYVSDVLSYGAIGARTVAGQSHRELGSSASMPIGFKNGLDGDLSMATAAVLCASRPQRHPAVGDHGAVVVRNAPGNASAHLVLRGARGGPNYDTASVGEAVRQLRAVGCVERVLIDASHGNSGKDHRRQPGVVVDVAGRIARGERAIAGIMLESFLVEGRHDHPAPYGVSVTDACLDLTDTIAVLESLADAVRMSRPVLHW
ncbi:3-deoxy-7-phosphoheptulonate synthase [Amycolatopsis sp. EV170708-02-1]|uniref:3-deoxy-7-phosphoheptulonate synthase n=1 Tax=Amycolatopsis sp. EV170708-02-1 TaxID=2919322 RepID=UPI001F0B8E72|nr:3-deoxy-7-phosphoheptulonate synthase [Amycolatopsis sp. EV170708-02-1]UMP06917.1 3-deoxy-7-phosphoheptulonate synthase [Amycolatopsis sp. EV170708-02-1]